MSRPSSQSPAIALAHSSDAPGLESSGDAIARIVDAAIEAAPDCVRRRLILPSIDWRHVPAAKVATMLRTLERNNVACPRWLATALLMAGHIVEGQNLSTHLNLLQRINQIGGNAASAEDIGALIEPLIEDETVEVEIVNAVVKRLTEIGAASHASRLALAHCHRSADLSRTAAAHIDGLVAQLPSVNLRLMGFSTTQLLADALQPAFAALGWHASVSQADFATALTELAAADTGHDAFVLLLDLNGFAPGDWSNPATRAADLVTERIERLKSALTAFVARSDVPLLVNTIPCALAPTVGFLDRRHVDGIRRTIDLVNACIVEAAASSSQIIVIDSDAALGELPLVQHVDQRLWFYGRIAYSAAATRALARAFAQAWRQLRRGPVKVVAVDFDNTLWGGVYGDDGIERLECGHEFPGNAFLAMQQECLRLRAQGILLVALSKNNADAMTVFEAHSGMIMSPSDFSAIAVNWEPKPQNIRKLADELNLGLDSFMFIDDSPQERDAMRRQCPVVRVPEMPADPAERPLWLRRQACTWPVSLTEEDAARRTFYSVGKEAAQLKATAASHDDFLRGLDQHLVVGRIRADNVPRIAQMHQRTNQFNLTTVRSTEADIALTVADDWSGIALYGRVRDRFGDHGIVITAIAEIDGTEAVVRSFLMSCRVIGRDVERAFLGELLRALARRGVERVRGKYVPTAKNAMVRDFYPSCGFSEMQADGSAGTIWDMNLSDVDLPSSQFVTILWEA